METSTVCKILMSTEISSNTPGNKQSKPVLLTTSPEKKQIYSKNFFLHIFFLLILFKPQYQEGIRREIHINFVIILSAFPVAALLCHANILIHAKTELVVQLNSWIFYI